MEILNSNKFNRRVQKRLGTGLMVLEANNEEEDVANFLPLKETSVQVNIHDSISIIIMTQIYENRISGAPQE